MSNTDKHEFCSIWKWLTCCNDVMNHVNCVIKRDVYPQKMHSCSKNIRGISCIKRPLTGSNESGLIQQVVFKCRFYYVGLRRIVISEQWSLKAGGLLMQVFSNTGSTVFVIENMAPSIKNRYHQHKLVTYKMKI